MLCFGFIIPTHSITAFTYHHFQCRMKKPPFIYLSMKKIQEKGIAIFIVGQNGARKQNELK